MVDREQIIRAFSDSLFLKMLDDKGKRRILEGGEIIVYPDGYTIVKEGDPGDAMYVIVAGTASVKIDDMGTEKEVSELLEFSIFGEMAVITNEPRSASVTARGSLTVLKIPRNTILSILNDYPKVKEMVAKIGLKRSEETLEKMMRE